MSTPSAAIRLVLADDHPIVLQGLQQLFERQGDFDVVRSCRNGDEALEVLRRQPVDVVVLDLRMPVRGGLDVLRAIGAEGLTCRVVLLTAALRSAEVTEVIQLGAKGLVLKESPPETLVECVRRVHRGEQWIDHETLTRVVDRALRVAPAASSGSDIESPLTPRELDIVRMVAQGLRNRDIGVRLSISEGTVKIHLHNVYEKLSVDGRLELLLYVQEKGWI